MSPGPHPGHMSDLGGAMFATAGCYFFGVIPSTYTSQEFIDDINLKENLIPFGLFDAADTY